jgi:HK97 family phage prohead protease
MPKTETNEPQIPDVERRVFGADDAELEIRAKGDAPPVLLGYAAKFNKRSENLGGFYEKIAPGAFDDVMGDDVRCLRNHNPDLLLGRTTAGTLTLSQNKTGLRFENTPPNTSTGRETVESVRRKDITGCSFAFTVKEDDWVERGDVLMRTIVKVDRLYDVGPVTYPAYSDTTVAARALNDTAVAKRSLEAWKAKRDGWVDTGTPGIPLVHCSPETSPIEPDADGVVRCDETGHVIRAANTEEPPANEPEVAEEAAGELIELDERADEPEMPSVDAPEAVIEAEEAERTAEIMPEVPEMSANAKVLAEIAAEDRRRARAKVDSLVGV